MGKHKKRNRVVNATAVPPLRDQGSIAKHFVVGISAVGALIAALIGGVSIYDRFVRAPNVVVESLVGLSNPFEPYFEEDFPHVGFEPAISITNLESKTIAVVNIEPYFTEFRDSQNHRWHLVADRVLFADVFDSEAKLAERPDKDSKEGKPNEPQFSKPDVWDPEASEPPFTIKSGETRYFLFHFSLPVYRDGERCKECRFTNHNRFVHELIDTEGVETTDAQFRKITESVPFAITLDDHRILKCSLQTFNVVVGDSLRFPPVFNGLKAREIWERKDLWERETMPAGRNDGSPTPKTH